MGILARRPEFRPITEAEAYARCHGDRSSELARLRVVPRPRRPDPVSGESLRRAFAARLEQHRRRR